MKTDHVNTCPAGNNIQAPNKTPLDADKIRNDFPILSRKVNGKRLVYLDSAATAQKPRQVIDAIASYYTDHNANVHRGLHTLAEEATAAYERARDKTAKFIGSVKREEIIFTRNTTEAINMVAHSWGRHNLKHGQRIVITQMEHHANLVPWIVLAKITGAELEYIPIDADGYLHLKDINDIINSRTRIVALTHMSNLLGTINPVEDIIDLAHKKNALVLVDGAQGVPHLPVDMKTMNADFYAFSAHKMLGPTGIGVLYAKDDLLGEMQPMQYGGEMINEVRYNFADWAELPWKFEAGTPNIAGAVGFSAALDYLEDLGMEKIREHDKMLIAYALERLAELRQFKVFGPKNPEHRGGAVSFVSPHVHPHDLAQFLDMQGIAIRAGHHCAQPLTKLLGESSTARASFYIYNSQKDIDELITALEAAWRYFAHV